MREKILFQLSNAWPDLLWKLGVQFKKQTKSLFRNDIWEIKILAIYRNSNKFPHIIINLIMECVLFTFHLNLQIFSYFICLRFDFIFSFKYIYIFFLLRDFCFLNCLVFLLFGVVHWTFSRMIYNLYIIEKYFHWDFN